jgi:hypothetical protein
LVSVRLALRNLRKQGLILQTKYRHVNYLTPWAAAQRLERPL